MRFKVEGKCKKGCYVDIAIFLPIAFGIIFGIAFSFVSSIIIGLSMMLVDPTLISLSTPDYLSIVGWIWFVIGFGFGLATWKFWVIEFEKIGGN